MKTTIEIQDDLLETARELARREGRTLRSVFEEALHLTLAQRRLPVTYQLADESFGGEGMAPEATDGGWEAVRSAIYEGRGT